ARWTRSAAGRCSSSCAGSATASRRSSSSPTSTTSATDSTGSSGWASIRRAAPPWCTTTSREATRLRPDRGIHGPERPTLRDIDALNRVFSESFTDRYARDGLTGVRVPHLNPLVWRYAIEDAGDGAMIWRDDDGTIAGFNMVHRSGTEGWMGPIAVRPELQGERLGTAMVRAGISWLEGQGARTIGLETMPRTVENIGFYSRLGFV